MERWLRGIDVMTRWGINYMELQSCILDDGLAPYDKNGQELHFKNRADFTKTWNEIRNSRLSERFPNLIPPDSVSKSITYEAGNIFFKLSDVAAYEKQHKIERQDLKDRQSTGDKKEVLNQAKVIWGDKPEVNETMAKKLHELEPGRNYGVQTIARWLKDEKYGRGRGRPKKHKPRIILRKQDNLNK